MVQILITPTQFRLRKLGFIKQLPYDEKVTAIGLIDRGASASLLYFWYNLMKRNYYPLISVAQVAIDTANMIEQHPEFEQSINEWFQDYKQFLTRKLNGRTENQFFQHP